MFHVTKNFPMSAAATGDLRPLLAKAAAGHALSEAEAETAFDIIMTGNATPSQMGALLMALRVRGETVDEITGAARIMRAKASALVAAASGVPVAKHGNRALSSRSGSADVLTALGVNIEAELAVVRRCLWEIGIG